MTLDPVMLLPWSGFLDARQDLPILACLPPHFTTWDDTVSAHKHVMLDAPQVVASAKTGS